jgi:hypothetical protein
MALEAKLKELSIDTALKTENTDTFIIEKEEKKELEEEEASSSSVEPAAAATASPAPAPASASASELVPEEKEEQLQPSSSFVSVPNITVQCEKDEYLVKTIDWKSKKVRIITQNGNVRALFVV